MTVFSALPVDEPKKYEMTEPNADEIPPISTSIASRAPLGGSANNKAATAAMYMMQTTVAM
jgi:hypothetical protein